jgi:hypothetical protein
VLGALDELEVGELAGQVHFSHLADTETFRRMFLHSLAAEKARFAAAQARFDYIAMDEAAAEMMALTLLAAACTDHLKGVASWWPEAYAAVR